MSADKYINRSEMEFMFKQLRAKGMSTSRHYENITKCMSGHIGEKYISEEQFAHYFRQCEGKYYEEALPFHRTLGDDSGISEARLEALLNP
jgi:hypothetical protein